MRGVLTRCAAVAIGFGGAWIVANIAFTVLDGLGLTETGRDCHAILCDVNWLTVALVVAGWLALGAWLTPRAWRWIEARLSRPAR